MARGEEFFKKNKIPNEKKMQANFLQAFKQLELERPCYAYGQPDGYRIWWTAIIRRTFGQDVEVLFIYRHRKIKFVL